MKKVIENACKFLYSTLEGESFKLEIELNYKAEANGYNLHQALIKFGNKIIIVRSLLLPGYHENPEEALLEALAEEIMKAGIIKLAEMKDSSEKLRQQTGDFKWKINKEIPKAYLLQSYSLGDPTIILDTMKLPPGIVLEEPNGNFRITLGTQIIEKVNPLAYKYHIKEHNLLTEGILKRMFQIGNFFYITNEINRLPSEKAL